jgi:hypothetical protein
MKKKKVGHSNGTCLNDKLEVSALENVTIHLSGVLNDWVKAKKCPCRVRTYNLD